MHAAIAVLAVLAPLYAAAQSTQAFFTVMPPGLIDVPACETAVTKALQQVYDCGAHFNLEGEVSLVVSESALSACACAPANATIISAPAIACKSTESAAQQLALFSNFGKACAADAAKASEATSAAPRTSSAAAKTSIASAAPAITAATSVPASTSSKSSGYAVAVVGATVAAAAMLLL
ncbi:hypothetical protein BJ741DRAFT_660979 [Chytriomyces cf. hyalinus JEL632]|nr:hypothetical protein BJ741DRAFT_660979 [Chytriomyces cf. hyalinus JEL632]